jgi:sugar lactone lactonase YvrE
MNTRSLLLLVACLVAGAAAHAAAPLAPAAVVAAGAISPEPLPGALTLWQLSPTGRPFAIGPETYLDGRKAGEIDWITATADADGWLQIAGARQRNREGGSKVWARTTVTVAAAESHPYAVASPGELSLYLNGRPLLHFARRCAPSTPGQTEDTVFLPLVAGQNEITVLVTSESPADWRLQVRDASAIRADARLTAVWERCDPASGAPESVAYDRKRQVLYVSQFGRGVIAKMALTGEVLAADWCPGLQSPTGLRLHADRLYAVERSGVVEIDPDTGAVLSRTPIEGGVFPNDLAIAPDGTIYVTDTFKSCVHRLAGGRSEVWLAGPEVAQPNGILVERDRLLVGVSADATIKAIDLGTKQVSTFLRISAGANMDGLVSDGGSGYLFSDYYGRLYHADAAGKLELLLDRRSPRQFIADFEYVPSEHLLFIPSLYDQRITALRWSPAPPTAREGSRREDHGPAD